ncbi:SCAN domain-containing protein 3-like [Penaeus monodon]|uniref:SCAN domain-containing protein 3-like n=1 Tax=Penaeus monodon TaxID=6687 RepID=UPI0018A78F2C|nr:SCAN domain-containing protein 3-like [Penaeus monodon]
MIDSIKSSSANSHMKKHLEVMSARNPYVAFIMKFRLMTMTSISRSLRYSMVWLQKEPEHGTDRFVLYEVLQCGDVENYKKRTNADEPPLYYVTIEETSDAIKRGHIATGHGGRDRMIKELQRKYANITTKALELFKSLCEECQKKRKRPMTKGVVVRPILSKEFASRGQVDLTDMQSMPHSNFKLIMVCQDHLTKFGILRPLQTKRAAEVAFQLVDIFLLMGASAVLQSDNGSEFTSRVITELKEIWPSLTMVHGKPRYSLRIWIKYSPYSAMFGCEARVGLTSSPLPTEVVSRLESEDDLIAFMSGDDTTTTGSAASSTGSVTTSEATTSDKNYLLTSEVTEALSVDAIVQTPQTLQDHQDQIQKRRVEACRGQVSQAERMVKRSRLDFKVGEPGDNVAVPIPAVDRGRGDPRNILGVIVNRDLDNDQYKIAVKSGVLKGQYSRNQFDLCPQRLLTEDDVNQDTAVSLREAVIAQSACGGQGFTRCNCSGLK